MGEKSSMMNDRIVLIHPPSLCVEDDRMEPNLGLLYIASAVKEHWSLHIEYYDMSGCRNNSDISYKMDGIPIAGIYGLSCLCTNYDYVKQIIVRIREISPYAYIVMGGPMPSALPQFAYDDSGSDVVIVGEGEDAFISCIEGYLLNQPVNGIFKGNPRVDIDSYPYPARELVDLNTYSRTLLGRPMVSLLSSRGCPHRCIFCNSIVMGGGAPAVRYRRPSEIIREMDSLGDRYTHFRFNDDCFTNHPLLFNLLEKLSLLNYRFRIFARVEDLTPETCDALRKAGCVHVSIGLESLDPDNLRILGKAGQIGREHHIRYARENGITVRGFFMVGLPYDSDAAIDRYFGKAASLEIDEFSIYSLIPYPGTKLYSEPEHFGYTILNQNFNEYVQVGLNGRSSYVMKHKNFNPDDVERWKYRAEEILLSGGSVYSSKSLIAC